MRFSFLLILALVLIAGLSVSACGSPDTGDQINSRIPTMAPAATSLVIPPITKDGVSQPKVDAPRNTTAGMLVPSGSVSPGSQNGVEGQLFWAGPYKVVDLHGNYYQMGRQYGSLLYTDLVALYPAVVQDYLILVHKLTMADIRAWVEPRYALFPEKIKQFLKGMSDATGIDLEKLKILANFTDLARITPGNVGCSGIAVWGQYTKANPLIFGRNFDWWGHYYYFNRYLTVTIFNPTDGGYSFASVGWAGELLLQTGMNSAGLFLESNDGEISGGSAFRNDVIHPSIQAIAQLGSAGDTVMFDEVFRNSQIARAMTINVADENGAYSYECLFSDIKRRDPDRDGLLVVTNHFVDPAWTSLPPAKDQYQTETRRNNLLALAEKHKGDFNAQVMMQVLDTSIAKGGATQDTTIFQVIGVPSELLMWIKAPGHSQWVEIDLKLFFKRVTPIPPSQDQNNP